MNPPVVKVLKHLLTFKVASPSAILYISQHFLGIAVSLMVSISGIRGIVGSSFTPETIVRYTSAFAEYCNRGKIIIGRDGRITGKPIANIVSSTLLSMGCDVIAIGVCPTPTIQLAVEQSRAAGGISITASHNPPQFNGFKIKAGRTAGDQLDVQRRLVGLTVRDDA